MADLAPTILDLCGVPAPAGLDGRSLRPLLAGAARWTDERQLIVQCPRGRERKKWDKAVLKTQRWRLVGGDKLYDLANGDSEVAAKHPDVLARLNASYDAFWESLPEPGEILSRHLIGTQDTRLNGMDWYRGGAPWNRGHFGRRSSGIWAVEIVEDGRYRFELRRYPREAEKAIGAGRASVRIGDRSATSEVAEGADHATIELDLKSGRYDLEALFSEGTDDWGAYFVYVSMVK